MAAHTHLGPDDLAHLHLVLADWQLLADLSFADLVMWLPVRQGDGFVCCGQLRPVTAPTSFPEDLVGAFAPRGIRYQLDAAYDTGRICRQRDPGWEGDFSAREETIPVRRNGRLIAVVARHTNLLEARTPSRLELAYLEAARLLVQMLAEGRFPFPGAGEDADASPRVGDGFIRLDPDGTVVYASPNAQSAYRRLGLTGDLASAHLGRLTALLAPSHGPVDEGLELVFSGRVPREAEVETPTAGVLLRAIPLLPGGRHAGAVVLLRDVSDLRRMDRALLSKDATIREIHHRVKNNLQTVAALLRLQARRTEEPSARDALVEAVRRVGSIAIVHETLAMEPGDRITFDEVADRVLAMVSDLSNPDSGGSGQPMAAPRREGSFGEMASEVATPLALALTEVLQNAVEHGRPQTVVVRPVREADRLVVSIIDDGVGLPAEFDGDAQVSLGLQIVRTLVTSELGGTFTLRRGDEVGTVAVIEIPLPSRS